MRYRTTVAIQEATETRDASGGVIQTWATIAGLGAVPATLLPQTDQARQAQMDPSTDSRQLVLAGARPAVTTLHSVLVGADRFEIDQVVLLVGERQTLLHVRRAEP